MSLVFVEKLVFLSKHVRAHVQKLGETMGVDVEIRSDQSCTLDVTTSEVKLGFVRISRNPTRCTAGICYDDSSLGVNLCLNCCTSVSKYYHQNGIVHWINRVWILRRSVSLGCFRVLGSRKTKEPTGSGPQVISLKCPDKWTESHSADHSKCHIITEANHHSDCVR